MAPGDEESLLLTHTGWREPSPGYLEVNGRKAIQERYVERDIRSRSAFTPKYCDNYATVSLLEKSETQITLFATSFGTNCPTAESVKIYSQWDILTDDPRSNQVVHRFMYNVKWSGTPSFWKTVDGMLHDAMKKSVERITAYFLNSSVKFLAGPPYEDATIVDGEWVFW